ncbi:YceI family protein [Rhodococcus sp. NBC_00294]|uniref:YceI family protein n=1 Tax=Rhodococcus sp. NBC_00294 TaxID=2976004 RepID=UPI002E2D2AAB|nr:YceI family protein [Rhodococcus sp. NBC_00294]
MTTSSRTLTAADGTLNVHTGVTGRASKMGHRLTIAFRDWSVTVDESDGAPTAVTVRVRVDSMEVVSGEGGVTPMFGPEKMLARSNALGTLDALDHPEIRYDATTVESTKDGYRLDGTLTIHGVTREHTVDLSVSTSDGTTHVAFDAVVTQTDFGVKPYSQLLGSMKVVDDVDVSFSASISQPASAD